MSVVARHFFPGASARPTMNLESLLDGKTRGALLVLWMFVLWLVEQRIPLTLARSRSTGPNLLLTLSLVAVNLSCATLLLFTAQWAEAHQFGMFNWLHAGTAVRLLGGVMLLDFWAAYVIHVLCHKFSALWQLHSVHHSDVVVDVTTAFRQHPLESLLRVAFLISGTLFLGLPLWIVALYQTLSALNAQLEHANVRVPPRLDRALQWLFVTPNYHKVHHSENQPETDSNYGNIFSLWDRIFSTLNRRTSYHDISYGLDYLDKAQRLSFWALLKLPFKSRGGR